MIDRPYMQSLRGKITNRALIIGILPVILLGGVGYYGLTDLLGKMRQGLSESRNTLADELVGATLSVKAGYVAQRLDEFMLERISDALTWASAPIVVKASKDAAAEFERRGLVGRSIEEVEAQFQNRKSLGLYSAAEDYLKTELGGSVHFKEIFTTDVNGYNVAITNPTSDFVQSDEGWWTGAFDDGLSLGQVEFDDSAGSWSIDISVRIDDPATDQPLGVMKAVLGVSLIQQVASQRAADIEAGNVTIINNDGQLLAETRSAHARDRIMTPEVDIKQVFPAIFRRLEAEDDGFVVSDDDVIGFAASATEDFYASVVPNFPGFRWKVIMEQPAELALSPLDNFNVVQESIQTSRNVLVLILLATIVVVIMLAAALALNLSRRIIDPVKQLQGLAERASRGDTSSPIRIETEDEIEDLAQIFDRMRSSLAIILKRYQKMREQKERAERA